MARGWDRAGQKRTLKTLYKIEVNLSCLMLLEDQVLSSLGLRDSQSMHFPRNFLSEPVTTAELVQIQLLDNGQQLQGSKVTNFGMPELNNQPQLGVQTWSVVGSDVDLSTRRSIVVARPQHSKQERRNYNS